KLATDRSQPRAASFPRRPARSHCRRERSLQPRRRRRAPSFAHAPIVFAFHRTPGAFAETRLCREARVAPDRDHPAPRWTDQTLRRLRPEKRRLRLRFHAHRRLRWGRGSVVRRLRRRIPNGEDVTDHTSPESVERPGMADRPSVGRASMLPPPLPTPAQERRAKLLGFLNHLGRAWEMTVGTIKAGFRRPFEWGEIIRQLETVGVKSLGIVVVTSVFVGMVMAVQFAFGLRKFGGLEYTGRVIALTFAREL